MNENNHLNGKKMVNRPIIRDAKGRFLKGTKASPGRKTRSVELQQTADCQEFLKQYDGDKTRLMKLLGKTYQTAIGSSLIDVQAVRLLLQFGCTMPTQKIEQEIKIEISEMVQFIGTYWKEKHPDEYGDFLRDLETRYSEVDN